MAFIISTQRNVCAPITKNQHQHHLAQTHTGKLFQLDDSGAVG